VATPVSAQHNGVSHTEEKRRKTGVMSAQSNITYLSCNSRIAVWHDMRGPCQAHGYISDTDTDSGTDHRAGTGTGNWYRWYMQSYDERITRAETDQLQY
jgi:hypothetical protein